MHGLLNGSLLSEIPSQAIIANGEVQVVDNYKYYSVNGRGKTGKYTCHHELSVSKKLGCHVSESTARLLKGFTSDSVASDFQHKILVVLYKGLPYI